MSVMRDRWTETTLSDVAAVIGGGTPSTTKPEYWGGEIVWLTPSEVVPRDGQLIVDSERRITTEGLENSSARLLPAGSVILTTRASVGFVGISGVELCTNQGFQSLVPSDQVLSKFLMYWIQDNRAEFESRAAGSTFKEISRSSVKSIKMQVPALAEQKRIVDVVSSVDAYIDALQKQADTARTARNAVLHELLSAGGDDWTETTLGKISSFISKRKAPKELAIDTPYVGLEHVEPKTTLIFNWGSVESVSSSVTPFEPEDTLFGRLRPYLHKVAFADFPGVCSPEILVLRSSAKCESKFLYLLCSLDSTIKKCVDMSAGTRMPRTSTTDLASIEVQLPPLDEQKQIVEIVSSMDEVIQSTEQAVEEAKNLRSGLLSSLLSGEHEIPESYDQLLGAA